jgi:hypothetical protein
MKELMLEMNKMLIKKMIDEELTANQRLIIDIRERFPELCPGDMCYILEQLGWKSYDSSSNGWDQDTWYLFYSPNKNFDLILNYSGFYWSMELYRSDVDD